MKLRNLSLLLGLIYVLFIGFGGGLVNLRATLFYTVFFVVFWFLIQARGVILSRYHKIVFILGFILSLFFSITTNSLMVQATMGAVYLLSSLVFLGAFEHRFPDSPVAWVKSYSRYLLYLITSGISAVKLREFFRISTSSQMLKVKSIPRDVLMGLLITLPLLLIFHLLFAQINADYAHFMQFITKIFEWLWKAIQYIFKIDFILILIKSIIQGYIFYIFLTVEHTKEADKEVIKSWPLVIFKMVLASVTALFLIFSSFQSKLLFLDVFHLSFQEVSQYVQRGFIELLFVAFAGYCLILFVLHHSRREVSKEQVRLQKLLAVFCCELIAITLFMFHKVYALQAVFGFKDQRILATAGIIVILLTFVLLLRRIFRRLSATQMFRRQVVSLASIILLLNMLNVDGFLTRFNSIRYTIGEGQQQKDYSYLLGNSYDNVGTWSALMDEARKVGIVKPDKNYY